MIKFLKQILDGVDAIKESASTTAKNSDAIATDVQQIAADVAAIRVILETEPPPNPVTSIFVQPGPPTTRTNG